MVCLKKGRKLKEVNREELVFVTAKDLILAHNTNLVYPQQYAPAVDDEDWLPEILAAFYRAPEGAFLLQHPWYVDKELSARILAKADFIRGYEATMCRFHATFVGLHARVPYYGPLVELKFFDEFAGPHFPLYRDADPNWASDQEKRDRIRQEHKYKVGAADVGSYQDKLKIPYKDWTDNRVARYWGCLYQVALLSTKCREL